MKKGTLTKETIVVSGQERSFLYYIPTSYEKNQSLPLLLSFHGATSDAHYHSRLTKYHELAEEEGFFVLYPESLQVDPSRPFSKQWNEGVSINPVYKAKVNDVEFIEKLLKHWQEVMHVDTEQIFTTGFSNGSGFSLRLAIELPNTFAGIGAVSGPLPLIFTDKVDNMPPLVFMMGTQDPVIPYSDADAAGEKKYTLYELLGAKKTAEAIAYSSFDIKQIATERLPVHDLEDATRVERTHFIDEEGRSPVTFYSIKGGGHTWPGAPKMQHPEAHGAVSQQINATKVIWRTLKELTKKSAL